MKLAGPLGIALWLGLCLFTIEGDAWKSKWAITAVSCGVLVAGSISSFGIPSRLLFGWMITHALLVILGHNDQVNQFSSASRNQFLAMAGSSLTVLLLVVGVGTKYRPSWDVWIERAFAASSILGAAYTVGQYVLGARGQGLGGLVDQSSMHGAFVILTLPFFCKHAERYLLAAGICLVTLMLGILLIEPQASTPLGAAIVCFVAWLFSSRWRRWGLFDIVVSGAVVVAMGALGSWLNPNLLEDSLRFGFYKLVMEWWWNNGAVWTGQGLGTAPLWLATLQYNFGYHVDHGTFLWLHSDVLQLAFETGLIGAALGLCVFIEAIVRAYRAGRHELVASLVTLGAIMTIQYPWRLAMFALVGSGLFVMALSRGSDAEIHR